MKLTILAAVISLSAPAFAAVAAPNAKDAPLCVCVGKVNGIPDYGNDPVFIDKDTIAACSNEEEIRSRQFALGTPMGTPIIAHSTIGGESLPNGKRSYCAVKKGRPPFSQSLVEIFIYNCHQLAPNGE